MYQRLDMEQKEYIEKYIRRLCKKYDLDDYTWVVYVLRSQEDPDLMYCGSTNNIRRRLRQHNRVIGGGGKYTSNSNAWPWKLAALITNLKDKSEALKVEYWTKAKNYKSKAGIPMDCPVKKRVYLIRQSMELNDVDDVIYIDREFRKINKKLNY